MDKIITILKNLKSIKPDANFSKRSLTEILNTHQNPSMVLTRKFFDLFKFSAALGLASLLIIGFFGGLSIIKSLSPAALTGLDADSLNNEMSNMSINIALSEAKYYSDSLDKVAMVLNETVKNSPDHLNQDIIEKELNGLDGLNADNKSVDDLLNELVM